MLKHMLNAGCNGNGRSNAIGNRSTSSGQRYHRPTPAALAFNQSYDSHHAHVHAHAHTSPGTTTTSNSHFPLLNLSAVSDASKQQAHAIYAKPMKTVPVAHAPTVATTSALMNGTAVNLNATTLRPVPVHLNTTSGRVPPSASKLNASMNVTSPGRKLITNPYAYTYPVCSHRHQQQQQQQQQQGIKEMLVSLVLLCLVSLLLALLSLIFLLKIAPVTASDIREVLRAEQLTIITAEEYVVVYEVTLALCALALSLNLCCLLVCAIQFLFAVKLIKSMRTNRYLQKASVTRVCAVGGFFVSIPVFLTGIILYTFIQFHSTPAIVTSAFIGLGIVFCGCAMVHNVLIWQREKTNAVRERARDVQDRQEQHGFARNSFHNISAPIAGRLSNGNGTCACACATGNVFDAMLYVSSLTVCGVIDGVALANFLHSTMTGSPLQHNLGMHQNNHSNSSGGNPIAAQSPAHLREASGGGSSISPAANMANTLNGLDLSSVATTNSPHELSTLV